jgi:hypothetical protein
VQASVVALEKQLEAAALQATQSNGLITTCQVGLDSAKPLEGCSAESKELYEQLKAHLFETSGACQAGGCDEGLESFGCTRGRF